MKLFEKYFFKSKDLDKKTSIFFLLALSFSLSPTVVLLAQEPISLEETELHINRAFKLYEDQLFQPAYDAFTEISETNRNLNETDYLLLTKVRLFRSFCNVRLGKQNAQFELLNFIQNEQSTPYLNEAYIVLADYYYQQEDYKQAIEYFSNIDLENLSNNQYSEIIFKKAYSHFVRKDFAVSKELLSRILHLKNMYYFPANYYYGMSQYFTDDLDEAVLSFQKLSTSAAYKNRIPYYIAQIYFNQKRYDELIDYSIDIIKDKNTKNIKEIRGLLGQAYFLKKDYEQAIEHLSYYVENTQKLRAEDFYQLGFAYYQSKLYAKAIDQFVEIANEQSKLGQNANNYLAESYLKTNNKDAARTAFKRTSDMSFIPDLAEEALFNYGKLSADMGLDREALNTLKKIQPSSIHFNESQNILANILKSTRDYSEALRFIEELEMQSPVMRGSYQRIAYSYGMQFLVDNDIPQAIDKFQKAEKNPIDNEITALTDYRLANIDYEKGNFQQSINRMNQYFSLTKTGIKLPPDADLGYANYLQAYNYLKIENFTIARKFFEEAAKSFVNQSGRKNLAMDALLRAGDCYFRINAYQDAIAFYNDAIKLSEIGTDYALYQRGILQGLLGRPFEKIVSMDEIIAKYPNSPLADFALFQNGETLQAISEPSEAERSFRKIVDVYKKSTLRNKALLKLGLIAYNQGNITTSISYYKELFNFNPNAQESQEAMIALEEIYVENLGKPNEYFVFIESQAGFKMNDFEKDSISFRSGDFQFENGEYAKAIDAYSNYIQRYPNGFNRIIAYYKRAESYSVQKNYEKALNDYDYVIKQNLSEYYLPSLEKAAIIAYNVTLEYKKSFDYYSLLEELTQDEVKKYDAQMGALRSAARIDEKQGVEYMANQVLKSNLLTIEDKALAMFYLAKINVTKKDLATALTQFEEVVESSDNVFTAESRYMISKIYFDQKEYEKSEEKIRKSIAESKPYPYWVARSLMLLSDVFVKKNDLLQAKAALEAVIENFTSDPLITEEAKSKLRQVVLLESNENRIEKEIPGGDLKMEDSNNKGN